MRTLLFAGLFGIVLTCNSCGDVLTAPTHGEPVIVDDGGLQPSSGEFDGGSALAR
jgi:hypothetical protein